MSAPYPMPPAAHQPPPVPRKSRTGLYIGVACGCLLLVVVLIAAVGAGLWLFNQDDGEPSGGGTTSESTTEDPTEETTEEEPTEETTEPTEDPLETPSEGPEEDPTSEEGTSLSISVSTPEEGTTLETSSETLDTENGKFVGVAVTMTNDGGTEVGLDLDNFSFVAADGEEYPLIYGSFSTAGPQLPAGEEATALLYADVPEDMELSSITYTDEVGTGGMPVDIPVS